MVAKHGKPRQPAQPNESLMAGLECLQALAGAEQPVGSREMARALGVEHTRVNRLLGTLAAMGLAERTSERKYVPGPGLHVLAAMSLRGSRLLSVALPHLRRLGIAEPSFSVALGVLWRRQVAYLYFADPGAGVQASIASRALYAAEKSSIGLAMLAARKAGELRGLYRSVPAAQRASLLRSLAAVRKQDYALIDGKTVGVAVGDPPAAGLALAGSITKRDVPRLVHRLQDAASAIARDLANQPDPSHLPSLAAAR
jgi:DNA-binding IclR family transcriptional regulator